VKKYKPVTKRSTCTDCVSPCNMQHHRETCALEPVMVFYDEECELSSSDSRKVLKKKLTKAQYLKLADMIRRA
jgi:hypothetical protein